MGVHNIKEYVQFHQEKLRKEQAAAAAANNRTTQPTKPRGGVNKINSLPEFRSSVLEAAPDKVILVDFFATWCGPCKAIAPTIAQWSEEYADKLICYKVDVDEANDIAAEYGIRAMPTFKVFKGGEEVKEIVGANPPLIQTTITSLF